ncbi:hypothetical protein AVEN_175945-1, partial [Araneus ventricosus]
MDSNGEEQAAGRDINGCIRWSLGLHRSHQQAQNALLSKSRFIQGKIMHTYCLKEVAPYKEKTVVVVGMGCSGLDAAVETSNIARQVYISTRSGAHVINRVGHRGLPYDTL